jgi:hypothetical protein
MCVALMAAPASAQDIDCSNPTPAQLIECRNQQANQPNQAPGTQPQPNQQPTSPAASDDGGGDSGVSVVVVVLVGLLGAIAGFAAAWLARRPSAPKPATAAAPVPPPVATPAANGGDRAVLVRELADLRDRIGSEALSDEIRARLEQVGVREIPVAPGDPFDANVHHGVDARETDDPSLDQRIASVERPGYRDGATVLRLPEVVVYRRRNA